jgi:hypothetical protein
MASLQDRMFGAARLDTTVYEEVEADAGATRQALAVVALAALAAGIGMGAGLVQTIAGVLVSLAAWYLWAFLTYLIGTRVLPEPGTSATHGELLRVIGFAAAPGIIRVLGLLPPLRGPVFLVAAIWMLVTGVVAVRQALDYRSTWRAVVVVIIGWVVQWVVLVAFLSFTGRPAAF